MTFKDHLLKILNQNFEKMSNGAEPLFLEDTSNLTDNPLHGELIEEAEMRIKVRRYSHEHWDSKTYAVYYKVIRE